MNSTADLFGNLLARGVPQVVGTISSAKLLSAFAAGDDKTCDLVEIRLDEVGVETDWIAAGRAIETAGWPVLLTIRLQKEGGKWSGPDAARLDIFEQALQNISAVDVEFKSSLVPQVSRLARSHKKSVVVSFHDVEKTPELNELKKIAAAAAKHASVVKITTRVNFETDISVLEELLAFKIGVPFCVIGMGASGTKTRVDFPALGSCLTYGYLDTPSAPGQLPARTLMEKLSSRLPAYARQSSLRRTR